MGTVVKCIGLLGLIFGHKFTKWDMVTGPVVYGHCLRCGMMTGEKR